MIVWPRGDYDHRICRWDFGLPVVDEAHGLVGRAERTTEVSRSDRVMRNYARPRGHESWKDPQRGGPAHVVCARFEGEAEHEDGFAREATCFAGHDRGHLRWLCLVH